MAGSGLGEWGYCGGDDCTNMVCMKEVMFVLSALRLVVVFEVVVLDLAQSLGQRGDGEACGMKTYLAVSQIQGQGALGLECSTMSVRNEDGALVVEVSCLSVGVVKRPMTPRARSWKTNRLPLWAEMIVLYHHEP